MKRTTIEGIGQALGGVLAIVVWVCLITLVVGATIALLAHMF